MALSGSTPADRGAASPAGYAVACWVACAGMESDIVELSLIGAEPAIGSEADRCAVSHVALFTVAPSSSGSCGLPTMAEEAAGWEAVGGLCPAERGAVIVQTLDRRSPPRRALSKLGEGWSA